MQGARRGPWWLPRESRATPQTPLSLPTLRDRADFPSCGVVASLLGHYPIASAPPCLRGNLPRSRPRRILRQAPSPRDPVSDVVVIAHRGASGERPEHTLESYRLAIEQGADYIEPDLVMTRDGVLIARHENEIGGTTDVANHPEFAARRRAQIIDGEAMTGWVSEDFTLAEIKTLRARERLPELRPLNSAFDGRFTVPTFDEIMQLAADANRQRGDAAKIGVYPETKHPAHFAGIGLPLEQGVLDTLLRHGYAADGSPVFIQSFDPRNLRQLRAMTSLPLVQLLEHELGDLDEIAKYADAIGIAKALATPEGVRAAHAARLKVHV